MLGRRDIQLSYMYNSLFEFIVYYVEVLTTQFVGEHTIVYLFILAHDYDLYVLTLL